MIKGVNGIETTKKQPKRKPQIEAIREVIGTQELPPPSGTAPKKVQEEAAPTCELIAPTPTKLAQTLAQTIDKLEENQRNLLKDSGDIPTRISTPLSIATYSSGQHSGEPTGSWLSNATYDALSHLFTLHQNAGRKFLNGLQRQPVAISAVHTQNEPLSEASNSKLKV